MTIFSIKRSFSDCSSCTLLESSSCILDTNAKGNLEDVDVVFVGESPDKDDIKKQLPLIGKAGKIFRKPFDQYIKKNFKWLLTNCVLCLNNEETLSEDVVNKCKDNCFNIIRQCNPKLIVLMGTSPMKIFDVGQSGITNLRGNFFKWEKYDVLLTVHPSFITRNQAYKDKFEEDIKTAGEKLGGKYSIEKIQKEKTGDKGIHRYKIPDKFYTDEYRLIDVQFLNRTNQILYIFRDKDNKKIFHKESDEYICYSIPKDLDARKIVPYKILEQVNVSYKEKTKLDPDATYEGDLRLTAKHAIDYYHYNQGEAPKVKSNIMFFDIEVDTGINNRAFPQPKEAKSPVCMITTIYNGETVVYVVENNVDKIKPIQNIIMKKFKNDKALLNQFITDFKKTNPDFISGWNSIGFDMEYLYNRYKRLRIPPENMSLYGEFYVDGFRYQCKLPGCVVLDQMHLYKSFTFTKKESYALGFISQEELKVTKIVMEHPINEMYYKLINKLIEYNIRDTELLEQLEEKVKHINLLNEIRVICTTSFEAGSSQFGQLDSIMISFLKNKGLASKNADPHITKDKYPGAFVYEPTPGIYNHVTDFDFTSLYPSIIMTYNIGVNNFVMKLVNSEQGYDLTYHPERLPDEVEIVMDPLFKAEIVKVSKGLLLSKIKNENLTFTINGCFYKSHKDEMSVYSEVLNNLLSSRKTYKNKMFEAIESKNEFEESLYNTKQLVYKVLANALYGVIANKSFRFFDLSCAAAVTLPGQEALKNSIIEAEAFMKHLKTGKDYIQPQELTKKEIYGDVMPDRKKEFIVTGDTDSIFCCFEDFPGEKTDDKILEWCNQIQTFLNEKIISPIVEKHNVDLEFNKLNLKNELIISRGLFLAKKYYVIHVVNQEGKKIDKTIYMGISVKRSDTPSETKVFLKELLDIILKTEKITLTKIQQFVDRKQKDFIDLIRKGSKTIAKPVSWGKELKDYKVLPQGVRGMINFNDISYASHSVGNRGYLFHVMGIDLEKAPKDVAANYNKNILGKGKKLEIVVIPDEEETLPPYYIVNTKTCLKTSFEDRYKLILKPLLEVKKKADVLLF